MNTNTKKVGIIGCGWLGFPLAKKFVASGFKVLGSTTSPQKLDKLKQANIDPYLLNFPDQITDLESLSKVDYLIINIPPGRRNPTVQVDYPNWVKLILQKWEPTTKVIFVGSTSLYGGNTGVVNEQTIPLPKTASGKALLQIEALINENQNLKNSTCILRLSGLVGGERHPARTLAGRTGLSNGDAPVNLVHRRDVINVVLEIIHKNKFGSDYNLSTDLHPTKREYYTTMASKLDLKSPQFEIGGASSKVVDNTKVKKELNYELIYASPFLFP